jgi:hypothetical protein
MWDLYDFYNLAWEVEGETFDDAPALFLSLLLDR